MESANTIHIGPVRTNLRQSLNYKIAYQWIDRLQLEAPLAMLEANDLEITADGEAAPFERLDSDLDSETSSAAKDRVVLQVRLPSARIGDLALQIRWSRPTPRRDSSPRVPGPRPLP